LNTLLLLDHSLKILRTGRCAKSGSLLGWCESMAWPSPHTAFSLSPLAPKGDHMCPLSKCRSKSAGSQEGLHMAPFSLAHLMICHGPKIGCLHRWGSQPLCSHVEVALFHRDEIYDYILASVWSVHSVSSWICLDLHRSEAQNLGGWYSAASAGGTPTRNAPKSRKFELGPPDPCAVMLTPRAIQICKFY
jgi:hypothetical protein